MVEEDSGNISGIGAGNEDDEGGRNRNGKRSEGVRRKRGRSDEGGRNCKDQYHSLEEYLKFSKANKNWLRLTRNERINIGGDRENTAVGMDSAIAVLSNEVDELQMQGTSKRTTIAEVGTNPNITTLAVVPPVVNTVTNTNNSTLARIATRKIT